jgi:uncharacterized protein GlcG (DUF336 family)
LREVVREDEVRRDKEEMTMIVTKQVLASGVAMRLVQAAVAHSATNGWTIAVVVVDPQGLPMAMWRMDDATPPILEFATDKAYTAATMRRSTAAFFKRIDESPSLRLGFANRARLMVWGGGLPIVHEGRVVGGIGVSGAKDTEDVECARVALEAVGLGWEL